MTRLSLQARLVRYLSHHPSVWINGAELGDRAHALPQRYKHDTVSRRMRILEEASRRIKTTPEHERGIKLLKGNRIEAKEMKSATGRVASVFYRFVEGERPRPKFEYLDLPDGRKLEISHQV